jgi:hypothetical protein
MPVNVLWDDPDKSILRFEHQGKWTLEETDEAMAKVHAMADAIQHRIDVIFDYTGSAGLPVNALSHAPKVARELPRQTGIIVVVGGNIFNTLMSIFAKVYPNFGPASRYKSAHTLDEAYALIERSRASERT